MLRIRLAFEVFYRVRDKLAPIFSGGANTHKRTRVRPEIPRYDYDNTNTNHKDTLGSLDAMTVVLH
jgi:hypothetical protein